MTIVFNIATICIEDRTHSLSNAHQSSHGRLVQVAGDVARLDQEILVATDRQHLELRLKCLPICLRTPAPMSRSNARTAAPNDTPSWVSVMARTTATASGREVMDVFPRTSGSVLPVTEGILVVSRAPAVCRRISDVSGEIGASGGPPTKMTRVTRWTKDGPRAVRDDDERSRRYLHDEAGI